VRVVGLRTACSSVQAGAGPARQGSVSRGARQINDELMGSQKRKCEGWRVGKDDGCRGDEAGGDGEAAKALSDELCGLGGPSSNRAAVRFPGSEARSRSLGSLARETCFSDCGTELRRRGASQSVSPRERIARVRGIASRIEAFITWRRARAPRAFGSRQSPGPRGRARRSRGPPP
jgi:hypothetical protein